MKNILDDSCCINVNLIDSTIPCPEIYDPVIGCDGIEYSNSCFAIANGVTYWMNIDNEEYINNSECYTCISKSGIGISETGNWINLNDPCDTGYCKDDSTFIPIIIDCAENTGKPCDGGKWVDVPGQCCSICIIGPYKIVHEGWNLIGGLENNFSINNINNIINPNTLYSYFPNTGYIKSSIDNLERFAGYWVKANRNGIITFSKAEF